MRQDRHALRLAKLAPCRVVQRFGPVLNRVKLPHHREHLGGAAAIGFLGLEELPPRMRPASDFDHLAAVIDPVVAPVGVRLQETLEIAEPTGRSGPRPVGRVVVDDVGIGRVAQVGPQPPLTTLPFAGRLDRHGRVVRMHGARLKDPLLHPCHQRPGEFSGSLEPRAHRATGNLHVLPRKDVFQAVKRQMVAQLAGGHERQQPRARQPLVDRLRGLRRRRDLRIVGVRSANSIFDLAA